ncbi:hypothetical protein NO932_06530 [Pelagibacterium sp. 26DY04]|uniref:hypothetical protein n=1 Tax=Pelagibacterium sp. 26DY04 TaxID=2967130 RepID=UPI002814EC42|nr:hypothetical protein [Pelagibacterium sp. 26DY04]WMT88261.1 hypothetical protein NO932_06530 [Pelagibacterium sp. 26DY04]
MKGGVFAVARNLFDHEIFADEPFTEREAWIWIVKEAAWKATRVRVGKHLVDLERGQCAFTTRFMATKFRWSEAKVRRFLNKLKTDAMLTVDTTQQVTRLTVCNYNDYQKVSLPRDAETDAKTGEAPTQKRRKEENRENIENNNTPSGAQAPHIDFSNPTDAQVYAFGKFVLGRSAGGVITNLLKKCEGDLAYAAHWLSEAQHKETPMEWVQGVIRSAEMLPYRGVIGAPKPPVDFKTREEREHEARVKEYMRGVL